MLLRQQNVAWHHPEGKSRGMAESACEHVLCQNKKKKSAFRHWWYRHRCAGYPTPWAPTHPDTIKDADNLEAPFSLQREGHNIRYFQKKVWSRRDFSTFSESITDELSTEKSATCLDVPILCCIDVLTEVEVEVLIPHTWEVRGSYIRWVREIRVDC